MAQVKYGRSNLKVYCLEWDIFVSWLSDALIPEISCVSYAKNDQMMMIFLVSFVWFCMIIDSSEFGC